MLLLSAQLYFSVEIRFCLLISNELRSIILIEVLYQWGYINKIAMTTVHTLLIASFYFTSPCFSGQNS